MYSWCMFVRLLSTEMFDNITVYSNLLIFRIFHA